MYDVQIKWPVCAFDSACVCVCSQAVQLLRPSVLFCAWRLCLFAASVKVTDCCEPCTRCSHNDIDLAVVVSVCDAASCFTVIVVHH